MGAGGSVAQELTSPGRYGSSRHRSKGDMSATGCQYREMLEHLRNRFAEEVEVLRSKHGDIDQDSLIVKLLVEEFSFTTVEVDDLPALQARPRDRAKVYLLGDTHFKQTPPSECVDLTSLKPKALEVVGDEALAAVAREALPANTKTNKKAVELMGSTKVVTEKKALKRLGSEMSESMRALQLKTERKEQQHKEEPRRDEGGDGGGVGVLARLATDGVEAAGGETFSPRASVVDMKTGSPNALVPPAVDLASLNPKALEMVGDEELAAVAREALPANTKTSKKAVELMGSTKVVTEKKALKRLGSEMSESMRALQLKTERKQQQKEDREGGGGVAADGATNGVGALGEKVMIPRGSMANMRIGSPGSFASSPMARRATRLLAEVPKFISDMGGGGSKADLSKVE